MYSNPRTAETTRTSSTGAADAVSINNNKSVNEREQICDFRFCFVGPILLEA